MPIDASTAQKIRDADLANILKKVKAGKTLTREERERIESATIAAPGPKGKEKLGIAPTLSAAASVTGLDPDVIAEAKNCACKAFRTRGDVDCDALLNWLCYGQNLKLVSGAINRTFEEALKARADRKMKEHRLDVAKRETIPVDEVKRTYTRSVIAAKSKMASSERTMIMQARLRLALSDEQSNVLGEILSEGHKETQREMAKGEWLLQTCPHCAKAL